jgi:hypothetical protein
MEGLLVTGVVPGDLQATTPSPPVALADLGNPAERRFRAVPRDVAEV